MSKGFKIAMGVILTFIVLFSLFIVLGPDSESDSIQTQKKTTKIAYRIINEEKLADIKTMIDIRLESELEKENLTQIANELKRKGRGHYERIFINYYLPDMEVGAGAWATSHFNPDLDVQILGLSQKERANLLDKAEESDNLIGKWIDSASGLSGIYSITKTEEKYLLKIEFKDGGDYSASLVERVVGGQKRWNVEGDEGGDYYVLTSDGKLSIYDSMGSIKTLPGW